jgi:hypothetical protein
LSIFGGFYPFLVPFFACSFNYDVPNVWFRVWGVDVVGVDVKGDRRVLGNYCAVFCEGICKLIARVIVMGFYAIEGNLGPMISFFYVRIL